jgi:hypothetical protein
MTSRRLYNAVALAALDDHLSQFCLPSSSPTRRFGTGSSPCRKSTTHDVKPSQVESARGVADLPIKLSCMCDKPAGSETRLGQVLLGTYVMYCQSSQRSFRFCQTNLYRPTDGPTDGPTDDVVDMGVFATRTILKGRIEHLIGVRVPLTKDEEDNHFLPPRDFSLGISSRNGSSFAFLGPGRFVNSDCEPNAKLVPSGRHIIHVEAIRNIQKDEEITIYYGTNYFGESCRCRSCQARLELPSTTVADMVQRRYNLRGS